MAAAADQAAVLHLWRYVGHLMGVDPGLLPATTTDAWRLYWLEATTEFLPDEDSRQLARALMNAAAPLLLTPRWKNSTRACHALTNYLFAYSRLVLGRRNADFLGAPGNTFYRAAVIGTAAIIFVAESTRRLIPGATGLCERLGQRRRTTMVRRLIKEQHGDRFHSRYDTQDDPLIKTAHP